MARHQQNHSSLLTGLALGLLVLIFDRLPEKVLWLFSGCLIIGGLVLFLGLLIVVSNLW